MSQCIKTHNLHTDRASSSGFNLMLVAEQIDSSLSTAIIKVSLD